MKKKEKEKEEEAERKEWEKIRIEAERNEREKRNAEETFGDVKGKQKLVCERNSEQSTSVSPVRNRRSCYSPGCFQQSVILDSDDEFSSEVEGNEELKGLEFEDITFAESSSFEDDETCFKCGSHQPPPACTMEVTWFECDNKDCQRWYHSFCLENKEKPYRGYQWSCPICFFKQFSMTYHVCGHN